MTSILSSACTKSVPIACKAIETGCSNVETSHRQISPTRKSIFNMLFSNIDSCDPDCCDCHEFVVVRAFVMYGNSDQKAITAECLSIKCVMHSVTSLDFVSVGA